MGIILGIDPGSNITGYGLVCAEKGRLEYVASGCIRVTEKDNAQRLQQVFSGIREVLELYCPIEAAIEQVFFHQNPNTALKLGHARGVAMVAASLNGLSVSEYSVRQIKQAVVGYGAASKDQVQSMVCRLLNLKEHPQEDAADALAVAICHAHSINNMRNRSPDN